MAKNLISFFLVGLYFIIPVLNLQLDGPGQPRARAVSSSVMMQYVGVVQFGAPEVFLSRGELYWEEGPKGT